MDSPGGHSGLLSDSDGHSLGHSLFKWLQTFELTPESCDHPLKTIADLSDGVVVSHCLSLIDPRFFDPEWLAKLKPDVPASNWRLKLSNLKKVLKGILDFYADVLGQHIRDFHMPDLSVIAERGDVVETGRLLQLVLGCAVNCDKKQHYIEEIMGMEEAVQHVVMNAIQELMNKETPASPGGEALHAVSDQLKKTVEELNQTQTAKDELLQRCHELNFQVNSLQEENLHLKSEQSRLNERLVSGSDEMEDPATPVGRKFLQLQQQIEALQESLEIVESQKDDLQIKAELQQKEASDLRARNEELSFAVEDSVHLKDELDILRDKSAKAEKMETVVETYKRKLEDAADVKRQMKHLEEKNASYVEKTLSLEEELKKTTSLKTQLENYKRQAQELQLKLAEEIKRGDRAEFERERNAEKLSLVESERLSLQTERDTLKETVEELTYGQTGVFDNTAVGEGGNDDEDDGELESSTDQMEYLSMPSEIKAKFIRLKKENKLLKAAAASNRRSSQQDEIDSASGVGKDDAGSDAVFLRQRLVDAQARVAELESENKSDQRKILELEASLKDAAAKEKRDAAANERLKSELKAAESDGKATDDFSEVVRKMESEIEDLKAREAKLESDVQTEKERNRQMEERYKRYLEKAKVVIKSLDPRGKAVAAENASSAAASGDNGKLSSSADSDATMSKQLAERDAAIGRLQKENAQIKQVREKEDNYLASAWYNLSAQLAKRSADERLASFINGPSSSSSSSTSAAAAASAGHPLSATGSGSAASSQQGQSFLARQRHAHIRKLTPAGSGAS